MASSSASPLPIDMFNLADPCYMADTLRLVNSYDVHALAALATHIGVRCASADRRSLLREVRGRLRKQRAIALRAGPMAGRRDGGTRYKSYFDYLVCIDFECTCEDEVYDYAHEIIEFPAVLVDMKTRNVVDEFHSYVKPVLNVELSAFCMQLVGVTQEQIDAAPLFLDVIDRFHHWLQRHQLGCTKTYAIVTDGPWDMGKFLQLQCIASGLPSVPHYLRHYVNLRRAFSNFYPPQSAGIAVEQFRKRGGAPALDGGGSKDWRNLDGMLQYLAMQFDGRPHCGLDDARNIAAIVIQMSVDGAELRINERLVRRDLADKMVAESVRARRQRADAEAEAKKPLGHRNNRTMNNQCGTVAQCAVEKETNGSAPTDQCAPSACRPAMGPLTREEQLDMDRKSWRSVLPYRAIIVNRFEFVNGMHVDCPSCDEYEGVTDVDDTGDMADKRAADTRLAMLKLH